MEIKIKLITEPASTKAFNDPKLSEVDTKVIMLANTLFASATTPPSHLGNTVITLSAAPAAPAQPEIDPGLLELGLTLVEGLHLVHFWDDFIIDVLDD